MHHATAASHKSAAAASRLLVTCRRSLAGHKVAARAPTPAGGGGLLHSHAREGGQAERPEHVLGVLVDLRGASQGRQGEGGNLGEIGWTGGELSPERRA